MLRHFNVHNQQNSNSLSIFTMHNAHTISHHYMQQQMRNSIVHTTKHLW